MKKGSHSIPRFISIEGGEGAGKSTLIDHIEKLLKSWKIAYVKTREPGGTELGEAIRKVLLSGKKAMRIDALAELMLILASRAQHIEEVIVPAITNGKVVLCDRFNDSTIAYQGAGRQLGVDKVRSQCVQLCGHVLPDLTFYLDIDPKIGLERTRKTHKGEAAKGSYDRIEAEALNFHDRVRAAFLAIAAEEPQRFYCFDARQSPEAVWDTAKEILQERFGRTSARV